MSILSTQPGQMLMAALIRIDLKNALADRQLRNIDIKDFASK
jgi:hypothetical protein